MLHWLIRDWSAETVEKFSQKKITFGSQICLVSLPRSTYHDYLPRKLNKRNGKNRPHIQEAELIRIRLTILSVGVAESRRYTGQQRQEQQRQSPPRRRLHSSRRPRRSGPGSTSEQSASPSLSGSRQKRSFSIRRKAKLIGREGGERAANYKLASDHASSLYMSIEVSSSQRAQGRGQPAHWSNGRKERGSRLLMQLKNQR